jgi:glutathione synthase/RimK-type ligase-like ATP-grasp enzyme
MILILAPPEDAHARRVAQEVHRLGAEAAILDTRAAGSGLRASLRLHGDRLTIGVRAAPDAPIRDLTQITAVWTRRPGRPSLPATVLDADQRRFVSGEWRSVIDGMTAAIGLSTRVMSPIENQRVAGVKPYQLAVAQRVGLRIPDTLITNDPEEAREFVDAHSGAIVHKAMTGMENAFLETRRWHDHDLRVLHHLPLAPTIFQELVDGPADIRVTIVGERQFAARIASGESRVGIDSRLDLDVPAHACRLPSELTSSLHELMEDLGLSFATIDLKVDRDGEYRFLELNPQGQFLYIEILTGQPIAAAVAHALVSDPGLGGSA